MFISIFSILLVSASLKTSFGQEDGNFWWLENLDTTTELPYSSTTLATKPIKRIIPDNIDDSIVCCECVPFYLCPNGVIVTDGAGVLELRFGVPSKPNDTKSIINVEVCPELDICCTPPNVNPICKKHAEDLYGPTLPADHPCECLVYDKCKFEDVVSDGLGNTSVLLPSGRIVSHSSCQHSLDVCCAVVEIPTEKPKCECIEKPLCGDDGYIITDGAGFLDLRFGPTGRPPIATPLVSCDNDPLLVCCYHREDDVNPPSITEYPSSPSTHEPPKEEDCECFEKYFCDSDGFVNEDGAGRLDLRIATTSAPLRPCPYDETLVCCQYRNKQSTPTTPSYPVPPTVDQRVDEKKCGVRNSVGIGTRILGFSEGQTQFGEFPWVVTLLRQQYIKDKLYPLFVGGASLIHPRVVLTAAHKVKGLSPLELLVRLGEWDAAFEKETLPHQDVHIEKIIVHPDFNARSLAHDVALLILNETAKLDYHIAPICFGDNLLNVDKTSCVTNGWGIDNFTVGEYQLIMKSINLPLVTKYDCQELLRKTRLGKYFRLHDSFTCAGGQEGVDSCKGDGGGPLACRLKDDPTRYVQVGITAWGIGCGAKDVPGVYVDVPYHYNWITEVIEQHLLKYNDEVVVTEASVHVDKALTPGQKRRLEREKRKKERQRKRQEQRDKERRNNNQ